MGPTFYNWCAWRGFGCDSLSCTIIDEQSNDVRHGNVGNKEHAEKNLRTTNRSGDRMIVHLCRLCVELSDRCRSLYAPPGGLIVVTLSR